MRQLRTLGAIAAAKVTILCGSTLVSLAIARLFGPVTLGNFSIAMAAAMFIGLFFRGGLDQIALHQSVKHKDKSNRELLRGLLDIQFRTGASYLLTLALSGLTALLLYWQKGFAPALMLALLLPAVLMMAFLQLNSILAKIDGRPVVASLIDMGLVQISIIVGILIGVLLFDEDRLCAILAVLAVIQALILSGFLARIFGSGERAEKISIAFKDRRDVVANSLLMLMTRNGYPLVFMFFVATADIGIFRLEERLAFTLTIVFAIVETAMMKPLVKRMQRQAGATMVWRTYFKLLAAVLLPTSFIAATLFIVAQRGWLEAITGLAPSGSMTGLLFVGSPFLSMISLSCLFLNLFGSYRSVSAVWLCTATVLFCTAPIAYDGFAIDGLRTAYIFAAFCGAIASIGLLAKAVRSSGSLAIATKD